MVARTARYLNAKGEATVRDLPSLRLSFAALIVGRLQQDTIPTLAHARDRLTSAMKGAATKQIAMMARSDKDGSYWYMVQRQQLRLKVALTMIWSRQKGRLFRRLWWHPAR